MPSPDPAAVLARVRALCLALPRTDETLSHGIPAFRVAGKMFAYFRHDHHGIGRTDLCLKTSGRDEQDMLLEADPDRFHWPAYIGPAGWIGVDVGGAATDWDDIEARVAASWRLAAPRRLAADT